MTLEEEIYAELVKRFGVSVVFVPKYGKSRPNNILWLDFITLVIISTSAEELYKYCGYSNSANFSTFVKKNYLDLFVNKAGRLWSHFLLSLISYKRCTECLVPLPYSSFSIDNVQKDNLSCKCIECSSIRYKDYRTNNSDKIKNYYQENKSDYIARKIKRKIAIIGATPSWADLLAIKEVYKNCPEGYHVDHVIPLQGKLVCGLHVHKNLKPIPAAENLAKGNKFEVL